VVVDPSIVGGVVARVGDQVIDGSVRRRLELARERLSEV
jgi:F-type H+-transporting ATPase subunit delta